ncbi:hypothetical protein BJ170DRAFT_615544 [Xylariales sp. AK1849]|nr:hypothetical protein BJ170DRAFT_615544 [Xylariales sp. AK1849]
MFGTMDPKLGELDPSHAEYSESQPIFQIVNNYLRDPKEAPANPAKLLTRPSNWATSTLQLYSFRLFGVVLLKVLEIPAQHPWQERLVNLLHQIQRQPGPNGQDRDFWFWLPTFFGQINEDENSRGLYEKPEGDLPPNLYTPTQWLNLHAFKALWYSSQLEEDDDGPRERLHPNQGLIALRETVELPRRLETLNQNVPSAAAWILIANKKLRGRCRKSMNLGKRNVCRLQSEIPIELYKGPDTWNEERWAFWKERFATLGNDDHLDPHVRSWAVKASEAM